MLKVKIVLIVFVIAILLLPSTVVATVVNADMNQTEKIKSAITLGGFDGKDSGGLGLHDVDINGHMKLYTCVSTYIGTMTAWGLVYNKYNLKAGKSATFSISGHIKGNILSPGVILQSVSMLQIRLQIYKGAYYSDAHPWKEKMVYYDYPVDQDVFLSEEISADEMIQSGEYYVAFCAVVTSQNIRSNFETYADFQDGNNCVDAYSAKAVQEGDHEEKPDLTFDGMPSWSPNPPEKNDNIKFTVNIINSGEGKVNVYSNVELYIDGEAKDVENVAPYDINNGVVPIKLSTRWPNDMDTHTVKIVIDDTNAVDESNEDNNVWTKGIAAPRSRSINNLNFFPFISFLKQAISV